MARRNRTKGPTTIYKTLHRALLIWATRTQQNTGGELRFSGMMHIPAPLMTSIVLLLNDTNIMWYGNRVGHQYM